MIDKTFLLFVLALTQTITLWALWRIASDSDAWRKAWLRDSKELLHWKRYAVLRDAKTGKYIKTARR